MTYSMPILFPQLYEAFGIYDSVSQTAVQAVLVLCIIAACFRGFLSIAYQNMFVLFRLQAKAIANKEDIGKIRHGFFARAVKAYVPILEKGAHFVSAKDIVEKEFGRAGFLIFNYKSIGKLIAAFENGLLLISAILAITCPGNSAAVGVLLFAVMKILAMIFDFETRKEIVVSDIALFIEVEIGQFYAKDTVSAIQLFGDKFKTALEPMAAQIYALTRATEALLEGSRDFSAKNETIAQQLSFIKSNQQSLDATLQQYEQTLKQMTAAVGEGIGKIISFHAQDAYSAMNAELKENLKAILSSNNELAARLSALFEQMQAQSRRETNAIISIKEQMDIYFESK
jgi:hypothetical protein